MMEEFRNNLTIVPAVAGMVGLGIEKICENIGGTLFTGLKGISKFGLCIVGLCKTLPEVIKTVREVADSVKTIAEAIKIKENEGPEELGMKAERSDKKPEEFDSTEDYIKYLRDQVEVQRGQFKNLKEEERIVYEVIGTGLYVKGIEEKYGISATGEFWKVVADLHLKGDDVRRFIETFKKNDISNMSDMSDYIKGKSAASGTEPNRISDSILESLRMIYPGISEDELYDKFNELSLPS